MECRRLPVILHSRRNMISAYEPFPLSSRPTSKAAEEVIVLDQESPSPPAPPPSPVVESVSKYNGPSFRTFKKRVKAAASSGLDGLDEVGCFRRLPAQRRTAIMDDVIMGRAVPVGQRRVGPQSEADADTRALFNMFAERLLYFWEQALLNLRQYAEGLTDTSQSPSTSEHLFRLQNSLRCLGSLFRSEAPEKQILVDSAILGILPSLQDRTRLPQAIRLVLESLDRCQTPQYQQQMLIPAVNFQTVSILGVPQALAIDSKHQSKDLQTPPRHDIDDRPAFTMPNLPGLLPEDGDTSFLSVPIELDGREVHGRRRHSMNAPIQARTPAHSANVGPNNSSTRKSGFAAQEPADTGSGRRFRRFILPGRYFYGAHPLISDGCVSFSMCAQHYIMQKTQQTLEVAAFKSIGKRDPEALARLGCSTPESLELNLCIEFMRRDAHVSWRGNIDTEIWPGVTKMIIQIRHNAVHRTACSNSQLIELLGAAVLLAEDCFEDKRTASLLNEVHLAVIGKDEELVRDLGILGGQLSTEGADDSADGSNDAQCGFRKNRPGSGANYKQMFRNNKDVADDLQIIASLDLLKVVKRIFSGTDTLGTA